jgi:uncharacterized protein (TIGR03067 family)
MHAKLGCALIGILFLGAGEATDAKKETAKFQGTWELSALTFNGDEEKLKFKIAFKDDEGVVKGNDKVADEYAKIKFKLDPAGKLKNIDITVTGGTQTDSAMKGIYEFKNGELHICAKVFGDGRPSEFSAPEGSNIVLLVLKKVP